MDEGEWSSDEGDSPISWRIDLSSNVTSADDKDREKCSNERERDFEWVMLTAEVRGSGGGRGPMPSRLRS